MRKQIMIFEYITYRQNQFKTVIIIQKMSKNQNQGENENEDENEISQNEILQMLHRKKMVLIEQCFQKKQKGLSMQQFLSVMLQHLEYDAKNEKRKKNLALALIDFFKEVDVNGDQTMEWEQFSNHIIQLGLIRNDRSFKNVIKSYFPSEKIIDKEKHEAGIQNVYFFEKLKNVFLVEKQSSRFKVYNGVNANLQYQVNAHKGNILDLEYLENQNLIATSSNDLTINFWDASSFTLKQIVSVPQIQLKIRYANWKQSGRQVLYTGGSDAIIHIYDASTLKQKGTISGWNPFYKSDLQQEGHSSPIGDILPIVSQQTLASACLGSNICLWDSNTHQLKKQLKGHNKGVYSLDWCQWSPMNQCLLSAGLDHQAFVWNTYVKDKIFLLRGHNHPLVGVKCLPDTPQIITSDIAGMVKVWDVRNFLCIQTFNVPVEEVTSFCLTYSKSNNQPMKKRIVCASKKLHFFEYDEPKDQFLTDEKYCIKILFNDVFLCFVTMHSDCIKIWDAKTGRLSSVYRGLNSPNSQLTAMILDYRQRKLFIGDSEGCIYTVNIKNGAKMKEFQKHNSMVTGLACWSSDSAELSDERYSDLRRVISISQNTQVNIHDEDAPEDAKSSCRYVMKQHQKGCNSVAIRKGTELLASGSDDGYTIVTNLISYRHEVMPRTKDIEVKHVLFLDAEQCLISVDAHGCVTFYGIGENKFKNKILFEKQYYTESLTNNREAFPISAINYEPQNSILILGDEFGNIECWDLSQVIDLLQKSKLVKNTLLKKKQGQRKSKIEQQSALITEIAQKNTFDESMIKQHLKLKQAHTDGITSIQLIKQNNAFATSSFDCCCYIWRISNGAKIGSLLLGGDPHWNLKFDLVTRRKQAEKQVEKCLKEIQEKKNILYRMGDNQYGKSQEQLEEYKSIKQNSLRKAKDLLQYSKKVANQDPFPPLLVEANRLQKQFFQQQDGENWFNVMSEVSELKKSAFEPKKGKNSKMY